MTETIALASPASINIVEAVRRVYERFPYPQYPLLAGLRWEDGYAGSSEFAGRLFADITGRTPAIHKQSHSRLIPSTKKILLAGGGEAQPYVLRKLEPANHRLICVELSRQSLMRARWRLLTTMKPTDFVRSDLDLYLQEQGLVTGPYDHVDMYGVLHHMPNPSRSLAAVTERLSKDATVRMMVYNSPARSWIHNIQAAFRDLRLDAFLLQDRHYARRMLIALAHQCPSIKAKLSQMGESTIANDSRLVDTFFHPREAQLGPEYWFELLNRLNLKTYSVFDRYGELDDLPNPLWESPDPAELALRAVKGSFEE